MRTQIYKTISENGITITYIQEMQEIIRNYSELYANKLDNLKEMETSFDTYNTQRIKQEEIRNINTPFISQEIKPVIKSL